MRVLAFFNIVRTHWVLNWGTHDFSRYMHESQDSLLANCNKSTGFASEKVSETLWNLLFRKQWKVKLLKLYSYSVHTFLP